MRTCDKCGHSLRMMQFKGETRKRLTCPDCGWRPVLKTDASVEAQNKETHDTGRDTHR